jgi:hypothetical protein
MILCTYGTQVLVGINLEMWLPTKLFLPTNQSGVGFLLLFNKESVLFRSLCTWCSLPRYPQKLVLGPTMRTKIGGCTIVFYKMMFSILYSLNHL